MITITVTSDGPSGSLVAKASANVMTTVESGQIQVDNQTSSLLYVQQMIPLTWVNLTAQGYLPAYENLVAIPTGVNQISNGDEQKVYLGFATAGTGTDWPDGRALFASVPSDDSWFFTPPDPGGPIVPLRISGSVDAVLTPQMDTDPLHTMHPAAAITVNWDPANPMLWITNNCDAAVTLYVEVVFTDTSQLPAYFAYPLPSQLSGFIFPIGQANVSKAWYGFAFSPPATGSYADAPAYFTAHPFGPDGHHTQEVPPAA
jgi:hypothetical protein